MSLNSCAVCDQENWIGVDGIVVSRRESGICRGMDSVGELDMICL